MRISRRSNTSDNKRAATRDNWISNLISGLVSPGWQVYRRKIHRDVFEIVSSEKSVPRFDSVEWSRDGGDKKDVRDACDEMCVCKTVFPRQVVVHSFSPSKPIRLNNNPCKHIGRVFHAGRIFPSRPSLRSNFSDP